MERCASPEAAVSRRHISFNPLVAALGASWSTHAISESTPSVDLFRLVGFEYGEDLMLLLFAKVRNDIRHVVRGHFCQNRGSLCRRERVENRLPKGRLHLNDDARFTCFGRKAGEKAKL